MDHPDNTTVRSAVGFLGDACWVIGGDNGWHRYPGRRVREAVRLFIAWTTIAHPPIEILANLQPTKDRATYLGAIDHPDNTTVRSAVGLLVGVVWVMDVVNAIGVCWDGNPDRCTYPTGLRGYNE
jgi:hypothetical protein